MNDLSNEVRVNFAQLDAKFANIEVKIDRMVRVLAIGWFATQLSAAALVVAAVKCL
ncbi:hypothetical protein GTP55_14575 [Duganella sp. FT109W]|uniref:Uncharacterized protein n=1 Tax=Duganella margarita TaxID=2692170 RepID=A0A7X4GZJ9_9BURK|nr:hypothetical protein [Duganella margarita]MYM72581.1 hypothetical protein [Duganella margarita]MYN40597.1 hypothetical protein [Duganella margarita]